MPTQTQEPASSEYIRIDSIRISIGSTTVELSPDQARELLKNLEDLLGKIPAAPVWNPIWIQPYIPVPIYPQPIWVNPNVEPWPNHWFTTNPGPTLGGGTYTTLNINC